MSVTRCAIFSACLSLAAVPAAAADPSEAVRWLREYIQIDTTNPPGNEREAAEFLAAILEQDGIETRLLTGPRGRTSLYARLQTAESEGRSLVLTHHIDVVAAGEGWQVAPFSGRPYRDKIWGRGALDVKGLGIAHLAAMLALKRESAALNRDLIFLAVADEELGGAKGTGWLLTEHSELFESVEAVFGEGGSNRVLGDRLIFWGIEVTQKRPLWLRVTAHGRGGHASGLNPESANHQLIAGLARLLTRPPRYQVTEAARLYLGALADLEGGQTSHLFHNLDDILREEGPTVPLMPGLPVYFLDTVQVTRIDSGPGGNIIAPEAKAHVDIRLLPETDGEAFLDEVREALGPKLEVEVLLRSPEAPASSVKTPIYRKLERALQVRGPVVPIFISGVTDSRYFRQRGVPAYGFSPFSLNPQDQRGIHAVDEYLPVDAFLRGIETMRRVLLVCAGEG